MLSTKIKLGTPHAVLGIPHPKHMTRNGKIARLPRSLRDELTQRLARNEDGAKLLEWQTQQEMFDEARGLAADAGPVSATTNHDLAEHLAAVIAGKFASLLAGWDGTEDQAFDAKLRVLTKFNQNLAVLRRANHSAARLRMDQAPFEREEQRLAAAAAYEAERSKERQQVFEQMMARKRAADQLAAETSAAAANPEILPTGSARPSTPDAPSLASVAQNQNHNPAAARPRVT